ncbi:TRAP transporter small permease (plasmid) [Tistrella bauzanensis]|jgi:TRAP-type C4-dicarboxylate transport system permease small subunit|uniref:TRAP transporter small permease protein n=1 Tax=Tistrella arctica TaxID=3133430 RepID=A0ABU9YNH8_9PROT
MPNNPTTCGFEKLRSLLSGGLLILATLALLISLGTMLFESLSRVFASKSFFWAEELVRFAIIAMAFLSLAVAGVQGRHIRAEFFVSLFSRRLQLAAWAIAGVAGAVFSGVLAWSGWGQTTHLMRTMMRSESSLELPMWIIAGFIPVGAALLTIFYVSRLVGLIRRRKDPFLPPEAGEPLL